MNKWSESSKLVRMQLHPFLVEMVDYLLENVDISLICGYRGEREQNQAYESGHSKLKFPHGKHNKLPSVAVDVAPYPMPKDELKLRATLGYIAGIAVEYARQRNRTIRWGGDWNGNGNLTDQTFDDLFHLELVDDDD